MNVHTVKLPEGLAFTVDEPTTEVKPGELPRMKFTNLYRPYSATGHHFYPVYYVVNPIDICYWVQPFRPEGHKWLLSHLPEEKPQRPS